MGLTRKWRGRWGDNQDRMDGLEDAEVSEKDVREAVENILADAPRGGTLPTFTTEQVVYSLRRPGSVRATGDTLDTRGVADEAIQRGVVESISPRQVGRFLNEAALKPHLSRYWLNNDRDGTKTPTGLMLR